MTTIIETRVSQIRFAEILEEDEAMIKDLCRRFALRMEFNFEWEYYAIYFTKENWLLTKLAEPRIESYLKVA
jgi:hypothetical protein